MPPIFRPSLRSSALIVLNACLISYQLYHYGFDHSITSRVAPSPISRPAPPAPTQTPQEARPPRLRHDIALGDDPSFVLSDERGAQVPGYCDVCGPHDDLCAQYGEAFLARSRAFDGAGARVRRVVRQAMAGEPVTVALLGGSVTVGRGVAWRERWTELFRAWWATQFPESALTLHNGAVPGTGTGYFSMCFQEHIPHDADLIVTEFAINDLGREEEMASFEWVLRRALLMEKQPAVINLHVFGLEYPRLATGGDYHTSVANYYDTPVLSLRNAVLPQILVAPETAPSYFAVTKQDRPDYKHINARMHRALTDILIHYLRSHVCAAHRRPHAGRDLSLEAVPRLMLQHRFATHQAAPAIEPACASLRNARTKLVANSTDGWSVQGTSGGVFFVASVPGARVSFVTRTGALGQVRVTYMRSTTDIMGIARCWVDDQEQDAVLLDAFWWRRVSVIEAQVVSSNAAPGEHTVWCELTTQSSSPSGATNFWIVGVDGA